MRIRTGAIGLFALALPAIFVVGAAAPAIAQDNGPANADTTTNETLSKPINLDVKSASLYYAITLMFDQLKIGNYQIPDELKRLQVSAHFTGLPIRTALEVLLKNSGYTYRVDNGVYTVTAKAEEKEPEPLRQDPVVNETPQKGKRVYHIPSSQLIFNAVDIVTRLGGKVLPGDLGSPNGSGGGLGNSNFGLGGSLSGGTGGFNGGFGGGLGGGLGGFGGGVGNIGGGGYYGGGNNYGGNSGGVRGGGGGSRGGGGGGGF